MMLRLEIGMRRKIVVAAMSLLATTAPALADDLTTMPKLPTLALTPQPTPSIWSGAWVGASVFGISAGHGAKGGFGGTADFGYNHEFANNLVVGVSGTVGYTPYHLTGGRARGYDFAAADVRVGYDMGRFLPYVTGGVAVLKPNLTTGLAGLNPTDSFNDMFNGGGNLTAVGHVGAGVEYAVTNNLTVGVEVGVTQAPARRALLPAY